MEVRLPTIPPLWREGLLGLEAAALMRSPVWRGDGVARGEGRPVLLIPGFLAGDGSLGVMTRWLRTMGYRTRKAGIRANVDCSEAVCRALEERLEMMADATGSRVAIVGQSRGGLIAKALAVQRPDLVSGIVALGSPSARMLSVHPAVLGSIGVVGALGTLGLPHLFTVRCLRGHCCTRFRHSLMCDFPEDVGFMAVYSKQDGIVHWRACLDPQADELIEVRSSHCGMAVNSACYQVVGEALGRFRDGDPDTGDIDWAQAA
jgi:triacylglycerol lipase